MTNWKLDGVNFEDYGVYVSRSQGVLDLPAIQNEPHDWLDRNGRDWDAVTSMRTSDREIVLTCWIHAEAIPPASAYEVFISRVNAFYGAILSAGTKTLSTPYGDIVDVYVKDQISLVREANYVAEQQIGSFTLRIVVRGDSKYDSYPVYHSNGYPVVDYLLTNNLQVFRTLQGDGYATCTIEANRPLNVDMYAYILVNTNGVRSEPYYFMAKPDVTKASTNKFTYNLKLEHGSILLKQSQFLFEGIADFEIFADLDTLVDLVCENADRFIPGKFVKGTIAGVADGVIKKNHAFRGEDCYSVVKRMAQEYGLEYDIRFSAGAIYTIDIKKQIATTKAVTLQYGKGAGLYELTREAPNRDQLVTVLYAYGSTKNLKPDYRAGKPRLEFDGNPLRQNDTLYMGVEKTVFFDDVYPQRTAPIQAYTQVLKCEPTDPGWAAYDAIRERFPGGMYRITDNTVFDIKEYLLGGLTAKIRFKTGELAGYEFEIEEYDHVPGHIFIKPFKDEDGYMIPNVTLYPSGGDEYTLVDIDQPGSYVTVAEAELLAQAQEYIDRYSVPEYPYRCRINPAYLATIIDRFEVGDRITVVDTDLAINQLYRISQLTYNAFTGVYELTLSEHRILNRRERQQIVIDRVERTQEKTDAQAVETIRKDKETVGELRNRIFDPADDRQSMDTTVRNESVDPRMLAFDAGTVQFQILGCLVETPWQNDNNKIHIGAGGIEILNWPDDTLSRYDIWKLERDGGTYDPRRDWIMPDTVLTLPDNDGYYLIAKLPRDPAAAVGEWVASDFFIRTKADADYIQYTVGYINPAASPRTPAMLWGNVKVSPDQITASIDPRLLTSGQMIYLHTEDSDLTGYKQALITKPDDAMATYTAAADSATGDVLIEEFSTEADYPGVTVIPAGPWIFNHWVAVGSGSQSSVVVKVYKRVAAGTETELMTFTQAVTANVGAEQFKAVPMAQVELLATDRLVVKYYHRNAGAASATMYLFAEGNTVAEWKWSGFRIPLAPVSGGLATVETDMSVTGDGSAGTPVELVGDVAAPGDSKYYGTDAGGSRGWHDLPDAASGDDNYVDGATFDEGTRDLTLTRTGDLEDITVNIPCCDPAEVIQGAVTNIKYGALYNWWAATDVRNIAPSGWHVPSDSEFSTLETYLGGYSVAGGKLKETGLTYWSDPNIGATNEVGFNARASGYRRYTDGLFGSNNYYLYLICTDNYDPHSVGRTLSYDNDDSGWSTIHKVNGSSIRLIKDDSTDTGIMVGNDGKVYPTVTIGTQVWMAANLAETKYRNGDLISNHGETYTDKYTDAEWSALTTEAMCWYDDNPDNGYTDVAVIQHNALGGIQGGSTTERYHHTKDEIDTHVYATGASGSFTTADSKTVTVVNGIITDIT